MAASWVDEVRGNKRKRAKEKGHIGDVARRTEDIRSGGRRRKQCSWAGGRGEVS